MTDLLFLVHRIPYPPNKGDKIRSWNILEYLATRYRVHVGGFVDDPHDWQFTGKIEDIAASACFVPLDRFRATLRSLSGLLNGRPLTCGYYRSAGLNAWVDQTVRNNDIRRVFVYSSAMAQYVPQNTAPDSRTVVDFVDIDSDKWRQYSERKSWPMSQVYRRESKTLFRFEKETAVAADASVFVSEDEAALFRTLAPDLKADVYGIPNGVDCEFFDPAANLATPYMSDGVDLVFTGAMDYWANVDAVCWFADEIFPLIRQSLPDSRFWIVGANPATEVEKLGERDGVTVTGRVEDVRPYIFHSTLSVAPLRVARGIQNKVLEAMALEKAVVASPQAMEGIAAVDGEEVVVADGAEAFADSVVELTGSGRSDDIGKRARRRVLEAYGWSSSLQKFESLLEGSGLDGRVSSGSGD